MRQVRLEAWLLLSLHEFAVEADGQDVLAGAVLARVTPAHA